MRAHLTLLSLPADQDCFKVGLSMQQVGPAMVAAELLRGSCTLLWSPAQHHVTMSHIDRVGSCSRGVQAGTGHQSRPVRVPLCMPQRCGQHVSMTLSCNTVPDAAGLVGPAELSALSRADMHRINSLGLHLTQHACCRCAPSAWGRNVGTSMCANMPSLAAFQRCLPCPEQAGMRTFPQTLPPAPSTRQIRRERQRQGTGCTCASPLS